MLRLAAGTGEIPALFLPNGFSENGQCQKPGFRELAHQAIRLPSLCRALRRAVTYSPGLLLVRAYKRGIKRRSDKVASGGLLLRG
jgi:hypothetical protein